MRSINDSLNESWTFDEPTSKVDSVGALICGERQVTIPHGVDIPSNLRPNGKDWPLVLEALRAIESWDEQILIETATNLSHSVPITVVDNRNRIPMWGIHRGHSTREPKDSPFLRLKQRPRTTTLSFEFNRDMLVRIMPGEYAPPLPWQPSAKAAEGGREFCRHYWREHSYVWAPGLTKNQLQKQAPDWF